MASPYEHLRKIVNEIMAKLDALEPDERNRVLRPPIEEAMMWTCWIVNGAQREVVAVSAEHAARVFAGVEAALGKLDGHDFTVHVRSIDGDLTGWSVTPVESWDFVLEEV